MKIAVNTHLLVKDKLDGIGWFTYETMSRIAKNHPEHEFYFIFDRKFDANFITANNIHPIILSPPARHPILWYLRFELLLPRLLKKIGADLFISPDGWSSTKTKIPSICIIHDLNFYHYHENLPFLVRMYLLYFFPRGAKRAKRVCTVSEYSKRDIINCFDIVSENIDVIYNSSNVPMLEISLEDALQIKNRYTSGNDYFMFVGSLLPRKNIGNMMLAFDIFKKKYQKPFKFVIVGAKKWWPDKFEDIYQNLTYKEDVIFTGRLSSEELQKVMAASFAVTYVSLFEGFGVPIVEAMFCSTAIITSNTTSMPEIAGDAALLCNPLNPQDIANAMYQVSTDDKLRSDLILKGKERRKFFSWDHSAALLWNSIEKAIE